MKFLAHRAHTCILRSTETEADLCRKSQIEESDGERTRSQRRQAPSDTGRRPATISPANCPVRLRQETSRDGSVAPLQARGHWFDPSCAHQVSQLEAISSVLDRPVADKCSQSAAGEEPNNLISAGGRTEPDLCWRKIIFFLLAGESAGLSRCGPGSSDDGGNNGLDQVGSGFGECSGQVLGEFFGR